MHLTKCFWHLPYQEFKPRYSEGPRDWQNLFTVTKYRYVSRFFLIYFTITGLKKFVRYAKDFAI